VAKLVELLAAAGSAALLDYARSLEEWSPDHVQMLDALAAMFARIALKQAVPDYDGDELHGAEMLAEFASRLAPEDVQLYYQTAILGRRDLQWAPDPRTGFEMTLLRMLAFRPAQEQAAATSAPAGGAARGVERPSMRAAAAQRREATGEASAPPVVSVPVALADAPLRNRAVPAEVRASAPGGAGQPLSAEGWAPIVGALELGGLSRQLAAHCAFLGRDGMLIRLALDPRNQHVRTPSTVERLTQALCRHLGETVRVEVDVVDASAETPARAEERQARENLAAARASLEADPTVRALKEKFGATLRTDTVRPHR
jgi:DNA polymerase-3 subunit gamma/tau